MAVLLTQKSSRNGKSPLSVTLQQSSSISREARNSRESSLKSQTLTSTRSSSKALARVDRRQTKLTTALSWLISQLEKLLSVTTVGSSIRIEGGRASYSMNASISSSILNRLQLLSESLGSKGANQRHHIGGTRRSDKLRRMPMIILRKKTMLTSP